MDRYTADRLQLNYLYSSAFDNVKKIVFCYVFDVPFIRMHWGPFALCQKKLVAY